MDNVDLLSNLKIRASYGEMGDDNAAGNYPPVLGYSLNPNEVGWFYGGSLQGGVTAQAIPNPNLTWYHIKSYNIGLDAGFLQNRLNATFDVFRRDRSGRSEEHTSELQSLMRTSYAVFCQKKKKQTVSLRLRLTQKLKHNYKN